MSRGKGTLMRAGAALLLLGCAALPLILSLCALASDEAEAALPLQSVGNPKERVWSRPVMRARLLVIGNDYQVEVVEPRWVF